MRSIKMPFNHVDACKTSVCFTWDDNCLAHPGLIAPQFSNRGLRCTFYINPGEPGFKDYLPGYRSLSENFFEIGSHGYYHQDLSGLPPGEFEYELKRSALSVKDHIGAYPSTFAFPYHAYGDEMLHTARKHYLETRNTLFGSERFSIRTGSTLSEMLLFIKGCVSNKRSAVFAGHSAIPSAPDIKEDAGHEPILLQNLSALLDDLQTMRGSAEVLTFEQAALKQYIIDHYEISGSSYILSGEQAKRLSAFGVDAEKLSRLI